jgi:putative membrane protein
LQIIRTIVWTFVVLVVGIFIYMNWGEPQDVRIWPGEDGSGLMFDWPVGFIALVFFLLGFLPMWLLHRGTRWHLNRRIRSLESAARTAAMTPLATEAASQDDPDPLSTADEKGPDA